ncbi:MAG: transcription termination factor NusA [Holosporales bacterium]|jgi:N utilization substance protein A
MTAAAEFLYIADVVAREKAIEREQVLEAMEAAMSRAGRTKYGGEHDIRAVIDRRTGIARLERVRTVVEEVENQVTQLTVEDALRLKKDAKIGDILVDVLPPIDFGRVAALAAKQVIVQKVREAERHGQFEEFKDRVGDIVSASVKRVEFGNLTIDLGRAEAYVRRDELIPRENFRQGDRIRAYIYDVRKDARGPMILCSRTHPQFLARLFAQEVPEIFDGIIEIRAVARDPGSRAKIVVYTSDASIDPVGACVGMRGSRVQAVVGELQGEKIDIIPWSDDMATLVVRALAPAEVSKVVLDEERNHVTAVVPDEQLSFAIGRRGQNVRLAAMLLGMDIDIITESTESARRAEEMKARTDLFVRALDVDDVIAHLLVGEGYGAIEDIAEADPAELASIEGFDEGVASELIQRAGMFRDKEASDFQEKSDRLGLDEQLVTATGLPLRIVSILADKGIRTLDDLADLAADELQEMIVPEKLTAEEAQDVIMAARAHWFSDDAGGKNAG